MDANEDAGLGLLGDPTRRQIFQLLARRPSSVGELARHLPISRPAVSQHLRVLKDGGLVVSHPQGTRRVYRLNPDGVTALRAWVDRIWEEALTAFQKAAQAAPLDPQQDPPTGAAMRSPPPIPPIRGTVTAAVPVEHAFRVFTDWLHTWWPPQDHIGQADMAQAILEPREGGRWYEQGVDGSQCDRGRVLAWEPPHRLVVTWRINGQWRYDPDPQHASQIEVRFTPDGPGQTTVALEHRLLDRLVGGQAIHDAIIGGGGWSGLLERFAKAAANQE